MTIRPAMFTALQGRQKQRSIWLGNGTVALSKGRGAVRPAKAKRSDVRKILNMAALHFDELAALWESVHGRR